MVKKKRKIIYLNDVGDVMTTMRSGASVARSGETISRICKSACGALLSEVSLILSNRLTSGTSPALQYGVGTLASGLVTVAAFGLDQNDVGLGSGWVTANQLINTGSTLLTGKTINQHLSK